MPHLSDDKPRLLTASEVGALLGRCSTFVSNRAPHRPQTIHVGQYCRFDSEVFWPDGSGRKGSGTVQAAIGGARR